MTILERCPDALMVTDESFDLSAVHDLKDTIEGVIFALTCPIVIVTEAETEALVNGVAVFLRLYHRRPRSFLGGAKKT